MKNCREIALKGSAKTISKFLEFAFYSVLYQRSVYPPEDFETVNEFGLFLIRSCNDEVKSYMKRLFCQIENWIFNDGIRQVCLVIKGCNSEHVLERWQFKILLINEPSFEKNEKEIEGEIRALMKQITASVTFLPLIEEKMSFDVIVYVKEDVVLKDENIIKNGWNDSDQFLIKNGESVEFRSFSTQIHKVNTSVTYKINK